VLGGGRYDGLMESLGGAATPAVGWAAGIERLAMLVGWHEDDQLDVAIAVEDDAALSYATTLIGALRNAAFTSEMVATGSPRKRFDKAVKLEAECLIVVGMEDGRPHLKLRSTPTSQLGERFDLFIEPWLKIS
jgi:histidyl-tRNA synthetase